MWVSPFLSPCRLTLNIIFQENNFSADALQSLSFALCHVYARSTRSVSIPAPVYCMSGYFRMLNEILIDFADADIVCSRAKNHYDPQGTVDFSDSATNVDSQQADTSLEAFRRGFKPLHQSQSTLMYFSVRVACSTLFSHLLTHSVVI
jgi:eukaryotic translation initiation factor 2C